jgi:hypothetical protein
MRCIGPDCVVGSTGAIAGPERSRDLPPDGPLALAKAPGLPCQVDPVYVGLLPGFDLAVVRAASASGVPYTLGVRSLEDMSVWNAEVWRLVEGAPQPVVVLCGNLDALRAWVAEQSDTLMVLYQGRRRGYTGRVVWCAGARGKRVVNVWQSWEQYA